MSARLRHRVGGGLIKFADADSGLQPHEVQLRLCSGSVNAAATQTKPKGCTSIAGNLL